MNAITKICERIAALPTNEIKKAARMLMDDNRSGTELVLSAALDELNARLDEASFVAFCAELEGA